MALTKDRLLYSRFELDAAGNLSLHDVASITDKILGRETWADNASVPEDVPKRQGLKVMYDWYDAHGFLGTPLTQRATLGRGGANTEGVFRGACSGLPGLP